MLFFENVENINLDKLAHISVKYDCFNDIFVNLNNVYETRKRLAQRIIELKLKGSYRTCDDRRR